MRWLREEPVRIRLIALAMLGAFALLGAALWRMQVSQAYAYLEDLDQQSLRRVRLPGLRGHILDRHGEVLADNRPSYCIALYLEELRQPGGRSRTVEHVLAVVEELAQALGRAPEIDREAIETHFVKRLPLPLLAWRNLPPAALARWAEQGGEIRGVDVVTQPVRRYPGGATAAHVLGYVGRTDLAATEEEPFHYYLPEMTGKTGVERTMDAVLRGAAGGRLVRVDVSGFRRKDPGLPDFMRSPTPGRDVRLTLDLFIQRSVERAMAGQRGAVVVLDAQNGDVLAMASAPAFDPNAFVPRLSPTAWAALRDDPARPMFNRAASGGYAPGSTFKPVVALAALSSGAVGLDWTAHCPGEFALGRFRFRCAHVHHQIGLEAALTQSCNVYFYRMGLAAGWPPVAEQAAALGLGRKTGVCLDHEVTGLLPTDAWSRQRLGHGWRAGDTVNGSIGQGALTATPLQMAALAAALGNGGTAVTPRLLHGVESEDHRRFMPAPRPPGRPMNWRREHIAAVQAGLRGTIMGARGTGRAARVPGVSMAGKTGTAEFGPKGNKVYRGWMIVYAPAESPRYAIAAVMDQATSGGAAAGPVVKAIVSDLLGPGEGAG